MEPEQNGRAMKSSVCPVGRQINKYRNSLPEVSRSTGHFFFKEVSRQIQEITYSTIGYRVGRIPYELQDLLAVVINCIHYTCELNLKIIVDGDTLWVTSAIGIPTQEITSLRFNILEADLNQSLKKTQNILSIFLEHCKRQQRRDDSEILKKVKDQLCKDIKKVFKNPDLDD